MRRNLNNSIDYENASQYLLMNCATCTVKQRVPDPGPVAHRNEIDGAVGYGDKPGQHS